MARFTFITHANNQQPVIVLSATVVNHTLLSSARSITCLRKPLLRSSYNRPVRPVSSGQRHSDLDRPRQHTAGPTARTAIVLSATAVNHTLLSIPNA